MHGLINYIDNKAKCRHLKKLTCKGTLRQVLIRVYRLEIRSVIFLFSTQLLSGSTLLCVYCILFTRIQYLKGGGGSGPRRDEHLPQSPFLLQVNFLDDDILHCLL
jgi:hypothetical protein